MLRVCKFYGRMTSGDLQIRVWEMGNFVKLFCCNAWTGFSVDGYELDSQEICWAGFYVESAFVGKILSGCLVGECWKLGVQSLNLRNACSD